MKKTTIFWFYVIISSISLVGCAASFGAAVANTEGRTILHIIAGLAMLIVCIFSGVVARHYLKLIEREEGPTPDPPDPSEAAKLQDEIDRRNFIRSIEGQPRPDRCMRATPDEPTKIVPLFSTPA